MSSTETVAFTARLPRKMVDELDKLAARESSSRNREILIAARAHLDADKQRRSAK